MALPAIPIGVVLGVIGIVVFALRYDSIFKYFTATPTYTPESEIIGSNKDKLMTVVKIMLVIIAICIIVGSV